eukprot:353241-Chlamydomonas_euryale.AAC.4
MLPCMTSTPVGTPCSDPLCSRACPFPPKGTPHSGHLRAHALPFPPRERHTRPPPFPYADRLCHHAYQHPTSSRLAVQPASDAPPPRATHLQRQLPLLHIHGRLGVQHQATPSALPPARAHRTDKRPQQGSKSSGSISRAQKET